MADNNVTTQRDPHYTHLDTRVSHLDDRVNSLAQDMSSVKTAVESMAGQMGQIVTAINTKQPTNWVGIGSLLLGLLIGGAGFVSLRVNPLETGLAYALDNQKETSHILADRGNYIARNEVAMKDNREEIEKLWKEVKEIRQNFYKHGREIERNRTANRAIGDYAKELGQKE